MKGILAEYRTVVICNGAIEVNPDPVWLPPRRYEAAPRQAQDVTEGGVSYLIHRDQYWVLVLPVLMASRCEGRATYRRVVRIEKLLLPDLSVVDEHEEYFQPDTIKTEAFRIPGCEDSPSSSGS